MKLLLDNRASIISVQCFKNESFNDKKSVFIFIMFFFCSLFSSPVSKLLQSTYFWGYFLCSVLHASALAGHASTVKLLLDNKASINAKDQTKHTPLFRACEMGHMDVVQTLIDAGAAVDVADQDGRSLLHW